MLAWGPWRPDVGGPNSGFAAVADNVKVRSLGDGSGNIGIGYAPFPALTPQGSAVAPGGGAPRGVIAINKADGSAELYVATATTIEKMSTTYTWSNVETGRTVTSGYDVSMAQFGSFLLNTDTTDGFKAYNVETPAGNNSVSGAPAASFIFTCNNVVFALGGSNVRRIQSSGVGDHTAWATKGANGKTFEDGGPLQCGLDLENGNALVFQSDMIRRIQFGTAVSPSLYSISKVSGGRGCVGSRAAVATGSMAFFLASDGFYKYTLDSGLTPIGGEKVNRWFLANSNTSSLKYAQAAIDPQQAIVLWMYFSGPNSSTTVADKCIGYNWQLNEWFTLTGSFTYLLRYKTPGYTLEDMDSLGANLDALGSITLDDSSLRGGNPFFGGMDSSYKVGAFSGPNMAYTLQSYTINSPFSQLENEVTPISDNANAQVALGVADKLSTALTWKTARGKTRAGKVKLRGHGLNIAFQETGSSGDTFTFANGIDYVDQRKGGAV